MCGVQGIIVLDRTSCHWFAAAEICSATDSMFCLHYGGRTPLKCTVKIREWAPKQKALRDTDDFQDIF